MKSNILLLAGIGLVCCFLLFCGKKGTNPETQTLPKAQTSPQSVLDNFQYIYNFSQDGLDVEKAINLYQNCFSDDPNGPQYIFKYWTGSSTNPSFWSFAEEMTSAASLFREVNQYKLELNLQTFTVITSWVESAADTASQAVKHPTEDWYVFDVSARLMMNDPNPANYPYLVQGEGLFYIRRCSGGYYRIVRWDDLTYLSLPISKVALLGTNKTYRQHTWAEIKLLF
jgi:hypothetical protein